MRILDEAAVEVLTLGDNGFDGGYVVEAYDEGERTHRRVTVDSPFVDGDFEVTSALDGRTVTLVVVVTGPNWSTISARVDALLNAVEVSEWRLEPVTGVQWVCRRADSSAPVPPLGMNSSWRRVTLTFPVRQARGI